MMTNNSITLYLDDTSARVMVTRGKRVTKMADMALETKLSSIDNAEKEEELAGKIKRFLKFNKISQRKIILGLSGMHCLTRPVLLPELPKAMLGEAVIREAKRILPVPIEQLHISWQTVGISEGKTKVYLVALPRQIADMVVRVLNKAGYKPYLMDIKPLALCRLAKEPDAVIVDVQSREFDIVVMVGGIPQPVRTMAFPQDTMPMPEKMNVVKEEFRRTLEFIKSKVEENQVKPETTIYVSGELAAHSEYYEQFNKEFGFKVEALSSPLKYLKYLEPSQYLVNAGLALKEHVKETGPLLPNFNTLPQPYQPHHMTMNKLMALPAGLVAVGVIALLVMTIQNTAGKIDDAQTQLDNNNFLLEKKQAQNKEMSDKVAALQQQVAAVNAEYDVYTAAISSISQTGNNLNTDMMTVIDNIGDGLTVGGFSLNEAQVGFGGSAVNEETVFKLVRNLMASGRFKEIIISGMTVAQGETEEESSVTFSLSCLLEEERQ